MSSTVVSILSTFPWFAWVAIVAIISGSIAQIVRSLITHNERMAMIRQGIHPDAPSAKPYKGSEL